MTQPHSTPPPERSGPPERTGPAQRTGLWPLTRGYRLRYASAIGAMAVGILTLFLVPQVTKQVIDGFPKAEGDHFQAPAWLTDLLTTLGLAPTTLTALTGAALVVILLTAIAGGFQYLRGRLAAQASEGIMQRLRKRLYRHLMDLPAEYFDQADTGDLVQRCTSDVDTVRMFLSAQIVEIGRALLLVACALPLLFHLHVPLAWVSLATIPVLIVYSLVFFKSLTRVFRETDEAEGRMTAVLQENLTGIRVVRSFARQDFEKDKFEKANYEHRDANRELFDILAVFWACSDAICLLQLGLVLFFGAHWTLAGEMTVGTMVAFQQYAALIIWPVRQMGRTLVEAGKARVSLQRLREILDAEEESPALEPVLNSVPEFTGRLEFEDLSFRFPHSQSKAAKETTSQTSDVEAEVSPATGAETSASEPAVRPWVLQDLSFALEPGQTLGLVGPPGSGKSAIVQLLLGLYNYSGESGSGSIRLDGFELGSLPLETLRRNVAVVLQSPFLYAKSIEANLQVGLANADEEAMQAATHSASLHGSIVDFSEGYKTVIGERGVTLSGGQKQRLAIARALLKPAPILILDDSLSAVDHHTEQAILTALRERAGKQTTIIISHRLSSVAHADSILVLDQGRVTERGTHRELAQAGGSYAHLWAMQSEYQPVSPAPTTAPTTGGFPS